MKNPVKKPPFRCLQQQITVIVKTIFTRTVDALGFFFNFLIWVISELNFFFTDLFQDRESKEKITIFDKITKFEPSKMVDAPRYF
jgi:hypothetical protein